MEFIRRICRARKFVTLCWFLGLVAVWEALAAIVELTQRIPMNVLPHTYQIIGSLLDGKAVAGNLTMAQIIAAACAETLTRAGQGFIVGALLGAALALLMDISKIVEKIAFPYLMIIQMIPILGMAPIILAITRDIDKSRTIIAAVLTFYPVSANTLAGFKAVEREKKELMFSYSANRLQVYVKTMIPSALPFFFSGLKISAPMAITASILVDTLQGGTGLGCMLSQSLKGGMTRMVFWDIVVISAAVGILSFSLMGLVEKLACPHRNRR